MTTAQLIAKANEFAWKAEEAASPAMAAIYWKKAENYFRDGGDDERADLAEDMRLRIG